MGNGLFADQLIKLGTIIGLYDGEVIDEAQRKERISAGNVHVMRVDQHFVDGSTSEGYMKFINHHFQPNCEVVQWQVKGETFAAVTTIKDIQPNEQLFFDYGNQYYPEVIIATSNCPEENPDTEALKEHIRKFAHKMHVYKVDVQLTYQ